MSTPKSSGELTYKQKKFCEYYIVSHNATESAIKAGYSRKTAKSVGCENLTKPDIQAYIAELEGNAISQAKEGAIATLQEVLEFYTVTMRNTDESTKYRLNAADKKTLKLKYCRTENKGGSPSGSAATARSRALLSFVFYSVALFVAGA